MRLKRHYHDSNAKLLAINALFLNPPTGPAAMAMKDSPDYQTYRKPFVCFQNGNRRFEKLLKKAEKSLICSDAVIELERN